MAFLVNDENFEEEVLKSEIPVMVDFWAEWCPPCRMLSPLIDKLAEEYRGRIKVCKFNASEATDITQRYGISAVPTLILFENGNEVERRVGALPESKLREWLDRYL
ncbi:MAG: thioredoxin [Planctomycetota bacterium]|nr:thioredoxin [Planctomycetota bacterium]